MDVRFFNMQLNGSFFTIADGAWADRFSPRASGIGEGARPGLAVGKGEGDLLIQHRIDGCIMMHNCGENTLRQFVFS